MDRLSELRSVLNSLQSIHASNAKASFTDLYQRGCRLLDFEDDDAARALDTSRPNASRWRRGKVVPPAASLVLKSLRQLVERKISKLERIEASARGHSANHSAMAAKPPR